MNLPDMGKCDGPGGEMLCGLQYNIQFVNTMLLYHSYFYFTAGLCFNVSEKSTMVPSRDIVAWVLSILRGHKCITQVNVMKNMLNEPSSVSQELCMVIFRDMYWIKDARLLTGLTGLGFDKCTWSDMNSLYIGYLATPLTGPLYELISGVKYELTLMTNMQFRMPLNRICAKNVSVKYRLNNTTMHEELYGNTRVECLNVHVPSMTADVSRFFDIQGLLASMKNLKRIVWVFENPVDYVYLVPILEACKHLTRVDVRVWKFSRNHFKRSKWGYGVHVFLTEALARYKNAFFNIPMSDEELMEVKLLRYRSRPAAATQQQQQQQQQQGIACLMTDQSAVVSLTFESNFVGCTVHRYHNPTMRHPPLPPKNCPETFFSTWTRDTL